MTPEGARYVPLGSIARITKGKKPKDSGPRSERRTIPYVNIKAFETGQPEEYAAEGRYPICTPEDVLLVWDGARAGLAGCGVGGYIGSTLAKIESDELAPTYLYYFLQSKYGELNGRTRGVGIPHVDPTVFKGLEVPLRSFEEQREIVAEIEKQVSRLDEAVTSLKRVKASIKRYGATLLRTAVEGRLVPTEADLARREARDYETGSQLVKRILALRGKNLKATKKIVTLDASDLPEPPEGWVWATLDMIRQEERPIIYGIIKPGPHVERGVPYVRVTEMKSGYVDVQNLRRTSAERAAKFARATLAAGDLLISKDGTIGRVAVVPETLEGGNITQHVMRAPVHKEMSSGYVVWAIRSDACQHWLTGETKGVALRGVNVEDFRRLPIPVPPVNEQRRILGELDRRFSFVHKIDAEVDANLKRAEHLRHAVLASAYFRPRSQAHVV